MISTQREILSVLLMLALMLGLASTAFAQNADVNAQLDTAVDAAVDDVDANVDVSADADASVSNDGEVTAGSEGQASAGATFRLMRGDAAVESSSANTISASSVSTESDVEAYAASTLRTNDALESVDVTGENVSVSFKEQVRLFGFIPMDMTSRIEVASDGTVRIERPWYSFLTAGASTEVTSAIEANVRNAIETEGGLTARAQARILNEVSLALGGNAEASASLGETIESELDTALDAVVNTQLEGESGSAEAAPQ